MKTFKDIINEVADPKPRREKAFKDKHVVQKIDHPVGEEDQFVATNVKKDKTKKASHHDGDDIAVYEAADTMYVIKHKKTKKVLNTHSDYNTAKDEHEGLGNDKHEYGVYKQTKKDAALRNRNTYREEVEQIDEISQDKLYDYHAKAGADLQAKRKKLEQGKLTMQDLKKGQNRVAGLNRAANKMHEEMSDAEMKKREDIVKGMKKNKEDLKKRYGDRWKSVMYATATKNAMESVEQIDELSKKTLGSYIKKAKTDVAGQAYQLGAKDPLKPKASWSKALSREKHIDKAVDRLTKESVDLDEAFKAGSMKLKDGSSATVTKESADVLNSLFKQLNSANKAKMEERLMSDVKGFNEILAFAKEVA